MAQAHGRICLLEGIPITLVTCAAV